MTLSYSISNRVNYDEVGLGPEPTPTDTILPAIYGNLDFGYTVTFSKSDGEITGIEASSSSKATNVSVTSRNSIRITKNPDYSLFPGENYGLVKAAEGNDREILRLSPGAVNTAGSDTSVFEWITPSVEEVSVSYIIKVFFIDNEFYDRRTETFTYTKTLNWLINPGIVQLKDLVKRSRW